MFLRIIQTVVFCGVTAIQTSTATAQPVPGPTESRDGSVVAAWTQIVPNAVGTGITQPEMELRFVIENSTLSNETNVCAGFEIHGGVATDPAITPTLRLNPRTSHTPRGQLNPIHNFPITLCHARLSPDWTQATLKRVGSNDVVEILYENTPTNKFVTVSGPAKIGRQYRDAAQNPSLNIVTLGDTGCKGQDGQDCTGQGGSLWPLETIILSAVPAINPPDVAVHVGDYRYYYEPGGSQTTPDTWSYWLMDFFAPARAGLLNAPWALARGNHEICPFFGGKWYGIGYEYLMGVQQNTSYCASGATTPPWSFDIAAGGIKNAQGNNPHRMVMIDNANDHSNQLQSRYERAIDLSDVDSVWWISHIPAVNLYNGRGGLGDRRVRAALESALLSKGKNNTPLNLCGNGKCKPSAMILGHDHLTQKIEFFQGNHHTNPYLFPMTYIVGHGGVKLRSPGLNHRSSTCSFSKSGYPINGVGTASNPYTAQISWQAAFGYVAWSRSLTTLSNHTGWADHPKDLSGQLMTFDAYNPATKCIPH
jgi:hypothetical protein